LVIPQPAREIVFEGVVGRGGTKIFLKKFFRFQDARTNGFRPMRISRLKKPASNKEGIGDKRGGDEKRKGFRVRTIWFCLEALELASEGIKGGGRF